MNKKEIIELLKDHRVKPSMQRIAIMQYLESHRTHPTVDEIYNALAPHMPTLSKTTVYNVLHLFTQENLAQMLTIDDKKVCFDANTESHGHFFCSQCGKVYDLETKPEIPSEIFSLEGHQVKEAHVYYKGICRDCLEKNKKAN